MKSWPTVKLSDVADRCLGKMLDAKKNKGALLPYLRNPNVRWFDVDLSDLKSMPFEDHESERYGLRAGDIVICEGGEAGRAAIWDGRLPDLRFQKAIHRVRPGPQLYNRYFVHQLFADYTAGNLADYYTGATIKHFTGQDLARYKFVLPPLAEQKRIAGILDAADALRAKRRAALAQLDALAQSLFLDLFGDPVTNPKGWEVVQLGSICDVGSSKRVFVNELVETGVPFFRGTEIGQMGDGRTVTPSLFITKEHYETLKAESGVPSPGDLLMPSICPDGRIYIVDNDEPFYFKDGRVLWIKVDASRIESIFLRNYLKHLFYADYSKIASGTTFAELKIFALKDLRVQSPPLPLQQSFAAAVESIEKQKARHREHLAGLDALFASLQHRAFRGEL